MNKLLAFTLVLLLALSLAACGGGGGGSTGGNDVTTAGGNDIPPEGLDETTAAPPDGGGQGEEVIAKSRSEVESKLSNYKITMTNPLDQEGEQSLITEMHWDKGHVTQFSEDTILYYDYENKKNYILQTSDKTGIAMPLEDDGQELFGGVVGIWLFSYDKYKDESMRKTGTETIAGRKTTVYSFDQNTMLGNYSYKLWIDNEYGVTLKMASEASYAGESAKVSYEVTEFKVGGVKLSDMINLGDYTITDMTALGGMFP